MGIEVSADPDDAKVLATAVAGEGGRHHRKRHHLLDLAGEFTVPILRPGEFLRKLDYGKRKKSLKSFFSQ